MPYALIIDNQVSKFPYSVDQFRQEYTNVSLPMQPSKEQLEEIGIFEVVVSDIDYDPNVRVTGYNVTYLNNVWTQVWTTTECSEEEITANLVTAKAARREEIKSIFTSKLLAGFTYDFGGDIGERTLDMRDADDKSNWMLLLMKCQTLIGAGATTYPIRIRSSDNTTFTTTSALAATAMTDMLTWGESLYSKKWDKETLVNAAVNYSDLQLIDIESEW